MSKNSIPNPIKKGVAKVPVVMQLEMLECGAASLAMILAYYHKWIPLEQVRSDCGVSRDGSNAKNVLLAARNYGLKADGYKFTTNDLKEQGVFPCIVHWEFTHFVVCNGFKGNKVYVNDPARGTVTYDIDAFDKSFTGVALLFEPTEHFEPSGQKSSMLGYALQRLKGAKGALIFTVLMSIISALLGIINPVFSRIFVDRLLTQKNPQWVVPFLIGLLLLSVIRVTVAAIQAIYQMKIDGKMAAVGSSEFMWKVLHMPMEFFSQRLAGDIQGRQSTNASIANQLVNTFAPLFLNFIMMFFYLVVMIKYSVVLSVMGISSVIINMLISNVISKRRINVTRAMMRDSGKLSSATVSGIGMIETIKASGAEDGYFKKWAGYQASVNASKVNFLRIDGFLGSVPGIVSTLINTLVTVSGVYLMMEGDFSIGMLTAFQGYLSQFTAPASQLISVGQTLQEMRTDMERIDDVMKYPEDEIYNTVEENFADEKTSLHKLSGQIELKNVTFGYSKLAPPLIKDFNMTIKPGQKVAFVGTSGCGKSTLSKLISGLYQPWSGEILFDGKPRNEIDRNIFTSSLSVVDQDVIIFEDTISDNIKMWDKSIEDFEVIMAARDAQIHDDIVKREGGYRHKMIEGGKDFSGGQRQRMEIARVLAQDPTIIIMDEATSALDAKTEYDVVKSIKDRGITSIVVAHRLSTIRDCDEIIVLDHGNVVERGTHKELFALGGRYSELVSNE